MLQRNKMALYLAYLNFINLPVQYARVISVQLTNVQTHLMHWSTTNSESIFIYCHQPDIEAIQAAAAGLLHFHTCTLHRWKYSNQMITFCHTLVLILTTVWLAGSCIMIWTIRLHSLSWITFKCPRQLPRSSTSPTPTLTALSQCMPIAIVTP